MCCAFQCFFRRRDLPSSPTRRSSDLANRLGKLLKEDYGLTMVLHPHGDSHIETPEEISRIFDATDPELVSFCVDTGHIVYGGGDLVMMIEEFPERLGYVNMKAFEPDITHNANEKYLLFWEYVDHYASL